MLGHSIFWVQHHEPRERSYESSILQLVWLVARWPMIVLMLYSLLEAPHQISSMTKQLLEKMHSAYQPEIDKETAKIMAGFST